jgi:hypothetical protein
MQKRLKNSLIFESASKVEEVGHHERHEVDMQVYGDPYRGSEPPNRPREQNTVIFLEVSSSGGREFPPGRISAPRLLGRLYFELRQDIAPVSAINFELLCSGEKGRGPEGVLYHYKGTRIHRIVRNILCEGGDLMGESGDCSRSTYNNGGLFADENFILRHTGPGCLSYCNRGIVFYTPTSFSVVQ